ncbi:MAG: hypothetical protein QXE06_08435, partial [Candidatus Bathyarchaeia archaeon]
EVEIETLTVATRITKPMYEALLKMLTQNAHVTVSDYIRDLIRKDLEQKGILKPKEKGEA